MDEKIVPPIYQIASGPPVVSLDGSGPNSLHVVNPDRTTTPVQSPVDAFKKMTQAIKPAAAAEPEQSPAELALEQLEDDDIVAAENVRHSDFGEFLPTGEVRLQIGTVKGVASVVVKRMRDIEALAGKELTAQTTIDSLVRLRGKNWESWLKYIESLENGVKPEKLPDALTQNDIDLGYMVVDDEILQRGLCMGVEMVETLERPGLRRFIPFISPLKQHHRSDAKFAPSEVHQAGLMTDRMYNNYRSDQDMSKVVKDQTLLEDVRANLIQDMTGVRPKDRAWNPRDWGTSLDNLFNPDGSGFKLRDAINEKLEGSATLRPILDRYRYTTIADLLVNIHEPEVRIQALKAYHDALNGAIGDHFKNVGKEITGEFNLARIKEFTDAGLIETARENSTLLQELQTDNEARNPIFNELQTGIQNFVDTLDGKEAKDGKGAEPGLRLKVQTLVDAIGDYQTYRNDKYLDARPAVVALVNNQNVIVRPAIPSLEDRLNAINATLDAYNNGQVPQNAPPEIGNYQVQIDALDQQINQAQGQALNNLLNNRNLLIQKHAEAVNRARTSAQALSTQLSAQLSTAQEGLRAKETAVQDAYKFVADDMPKMVQTATALWTRINDILVNPPIPQDLRRYNAELTNIRNSIDTMRNFITADFLQGNAANVFRPTGESLQNYAARFNYQLNGQNFRNLILDLNVRVGDLKEIIEPEENEEFTARQSGVNLVLAIVDKPPTKEGQPEGVAVIGKVNERLMAEMRDGDRKVLERLYKNLDLDVIRDLLCNHAEVLKNEALRDPAIQGRVFSDRFVLETAADFYRDMEFPTADPNLDSANDAYRIALIKRMGSTHVELSQFLTYLVERRLNDASQQTTRVTAIREASYRPGRPRDPIGYHNVDVRGPAAGIFSVESNDSFIGRMRNERAPLLPVRSELVRVKNVGRVQELANESIDFPGGRRFFRAQNVRIVNEHFTFDDGAGQQRELPVSIDFRSGQGGQSYSINVKADRSLNGIPGIPGPLNGRWVNLLGIRDRITGRRDFVDYNTFETSLDTLLPGVPPGETGKMVLRSLGDYFLAMKSDDRDFKFSRFPTTDIPARYPALALNFQRIMLDSGGRVILYNATTNEAVPFETARRTVSQDQADQLLQFVGEIVFDTLGR